jgi:hypothetical protein
VHQILNYAIADVEDVIGRGVIDGKGNVDNEAVAQEAATLEDNGVPSSDSIYIA